MLASPIRTAPLIRTGKYGKRAAGAGGTKAGVDHEGVDVRAAVGTPVYPTIAGTVVQTITGWQSERSPGVSRGRGIFRPGMGGNQVVIRGDDGRDHNDGHLSSVAVQVGQRVDTSTMLGRSGYTGVKEPHLHHGVWIEYAPNRWRSIDPTPLLPWDGDKFMELEAKPRDEKPAVPAAEPEEDRMSSFTPDLFINRTQSDGPVGLGVAIYPSGFVKALTQAQWEAWIMLGAKPVDVTVGGHWSFLMGCATELRSASQVAPAHMSDEEIQRIASEVAAQTDRTDVDDIARGVVDMLGKSLVTGAAPS